LHLWFVAAGLALIVWAALLANAAERKELAT